MTNTANIQHIFDTARIKAEEASIARETMASALLQVFQKIMPPGTILDLRFGRHNPPPIYLSHVRTLRGNDRGTKVFRIVKVVAVDATPSHPDFSTWIADAVPISEKTGKDMLASSGHSAGHATVRLHGQASCGEHPDEDPGEPVRRLIELIAKHSPANE